MDSVVSVGKASFVKKVQKLFLTKKRTIKIKGKKVDVSPFKSNPFTPSDVKLKSHSENAYVLRFILKNKKNGAKSPKSLLFYHLFNKQIKKDSDAIKILDGLRKYTTKRTVNVLYIADHLEPKSILVLKHLLRAYKRLSLRRIVRIRYRRIRLFSGIVLHHHHHHRY